MKIFGIILVFFSHPLIAQAESPPDESNPVIASVIVASQAYSFEKWEKYCNKAFPAYTQEILSARTKWLETHNDLYEKAGVVIRDQIPKNDRIGLVREWNMMAKQLESSLQAANINERKNWCKNSPKRILDPRMNLLTRVKLVDAIYKYEGK